MTNKKGAEPISKRRERHVINEVNQFYHEGINQDNYRICRCRGYHRTSAFGYFFLGGESDIKRVESKQTIVDNWDECKLNDYGYISRGLSKSCYAIYDKKKNILILDPNVCPEPGLVLKAVNKDCGVFLVRNITDVNITNKPKQLALSRLDYLIDELLTRHFSYFYRLVKGTNITIYTAKIYDKDVVKIINEIKAIVNDWKTIPRDKSLGKSSVYFGSTGPYDYRDIDFPTINDIIHYKVFSKEEIKLIHQRKWWTKNCYGKGISFKETQANWNTKVNDVFKGVILWQTDIVNRNKETFKLWNERIYKLEKEVAAKRKESIDKILNIPIAEQLDRWRKQTKYSGYDKFAIIYDDFRVKGRTIEWYKHKEFVSLNCFENKQLKLSEDGKEVITSGNARVTLIHAIALFNKLYDDYIVRHWIEINKDYYIDFTNKHVTIGYYQLRRIGYCTKYTDYHHVAKSYKEWFVEIGCHVLWFDDVKEFCRYYHLEDKVHFNCKEVKR